MLNKQNERELAYVVYVDEIRPIPGRDRVECAVVGGWTCMVPKGAFQKGDPGVYFEIDSQVPLDNPVFSFCAKYKGAIKTQKFKTPEGQFWSQGLLMAASDFGWFVAYTDEYNYIYDKEGNSYIPGTDSAFLTKKLGVTYSVAEDNDRKANNVDKYKKMAQRRPDVFKKPFVKWLYKYTWGKKLLFVFFGKKKDTRNWPSWVVKTDEERVQNMPWILNDKGPWYATEKIDGTSTTFTMKGFGKKREFYVCSRNVNFDTPEKKENGGYYNTNVYVEMAEKYNIEKVLADILDKYKKDPLLELEFVTLQGETYGEGIQKRDYGLKGHDFMAFNLIYGYKNGTVKRWNPAEMDIFLYQYNIPCVPIVDANFVLPDTVEELLAYATGDSKVDGGMREGIVFRDEMGERSFKAVSNEFLLKYHNG
jgi:hypothetical protein